jgi:hypothetical protein
MHRRSAAMLSQRQQTGVQQTIKSPFWSASLDRAPRSQGRITGYRIGRAQSAGMNAVLLPAYHSPRALMPEMGH